MGRALPLLRRFIAEELPRHKLNVRVDNGLFKFTVRDLRRYFARYLGSEVVGALIAITAGGYLVAELDRFGYEVVQSRRGVYVVRRVGGNER